VAGANTLVLIPVFPSPRTDARFRGRILMAIPPVAVLSSLHYKSTCCVWCSLRRDRGRGAKSDGDHQLRRLFLSALEQAGRNTCNTGISSKMRLTHQAGKVRNFTRQIRELSGPMLSSDCDRTMPDPDLQCTGMTSGQSRNSSGNRNLSHAH